MTDGTTKKQKEGESHSDKRLIRDRTFAALQFPNYRLWFQGQIVSLFGTWMQTTAQGFLIFELTHSPAYLGYVGFASGIPVWILTLYGGVVADRIPRRSLLIITQSAMMVFAFVLAALAFLHIVQPWHVVLLSFCLGTANAFDAPARQAFVGEMVDRDYLTNAIALNGTMFNTAMAIGPAVAGVTYALFGPAWCFTLNGISFIAVIFALQRMKIKPQPHLLDAGEEGKFKEGILYVVHHDLIRVVIGVVALNSMFTQSIVTLIPAWSVTILGGDAMTNGFLNSARGVGSVMGALVIATLGSITYRGKLVTFGTFLAPALLLVFATVHWLPASLVVIIGIGLGTIMVMNLANALVQTSTPQHLRGRVMGAYTWIFFGFMPIGALWSGEMAARFGLAEAVTINGSIALAAAVAIFVFFPKLREH